MSNGRRSIRLTSGTGRTPREVGPLSGWGWVDGCAEFVGLVRGFSELNLWFSHRLMMACVFLRWTGQLYSSWSLEGGLILAGGIYSFTSSQTLPSSLPIIHPPSSITHPIHPPTHSKIAIHRNLRLQPPTQPIESLLGPRHRTDVHPPIR